MAADWTASLLDQNALRAGVVAFAHRGRDGGARLAPRAVRPARGLGRRAGDERDVRQLHRRSAAPPTGGASGTAPTRSATGSPGCPGCRCCPAVMCTPARARRCRCSATAGTRSRCSPATRSGRVDLDAMARRCPTLDGAPAVIIANAGEVNAGDFDPLDDLADLAAAHGAWLHVDGAFGLFAALSPRTAHLVARHRAGRLDRRRRPQVAQRPVRERIRADPRPGAARRGVRHARRGVPARPAATPAAATASRPRVVAPGPVACPIWATLAAYGRDGYRAMVERHLDLAQHLAAPGRRGARPGTPRRRAAVHRLLPGTPAGRTGGRAGRL